MCLCAGATKQPNAAKSVMAAFVFIVLQRAAHHARLCLVAGLVAGLTLPGVALFIKDLLPMLVALLLCTSAIRIGLKGTMGGLTDLRQTIVKLAVLQFAMPVAALGLILAFGLLSHPLAIAVLLMLSAPSISGSANFTAIMGHNPAPPMRLLILGTMVFPVTALATLWVVPGIGGLGDLFFTAARFAVVIAVSVGVGFAIRRAAFPNPNAQQIKALDGASALLLAIMVVGLMSALGPAFKTAPYTVAGWLAAAIVVNFGLQIMAWLWGTDPGTCIVAGNRNVALYLVALPAAATEPLLIFIGCYQIPMYLTPILMQRLYKSERNAPNRA